MKRTWFARLAALALALGMGSAVGIAISQNAAIEADAATAHPTGTAANWVKITSAGDVNTTDPFLIGYEDGDNKYFCTGVTSSSALVVSQTFSEATVVKFTEKTGGYSMSFDGEKVVRNNSSTGISLSTTDDSIWTITGSAAPYRLTNTANGNRYLGLTGAAGTNLKAYATSSTNTPATVFKYSASVDPSKVTGISLDKSFEILKIGGSALTITPTVSPSTAADKSVAWTSSNESVATVIDGVVSPIANGTTTITAKTNDGDFTATCKIAVANHTGSSAEDALTPTDVAIVKDNCTTTPSIQPTVGKYYVAGNVKALEWYSNSGYQATMTLTDGETDIGVYRLYDVGSSNVKFTDTTKIQVTDNIVIYTALYNDTSFCKYGNLVSVQSTITVTSVEIGGTMPFTQYVGEAWDTSKVTATANYSNSTSADVTASASFSCDPAVPSAAGVQTVRVFGTFSEVQGYKDFEINVLPVPASMTEDTISFTSFDFGESPTNGYQDTTGASATTGVTYAGNMYYSGTQTLIQLRTDAANEKHPGFIATAPYGKYIKSVTVVYDLPDHPAKALSLFASADPIASVESMFDSSLTALTVLNAGHETANLPVNAKYFGIRSVNGAVYIKSVTVTYVNYAASDVVNLVKTLAGGWENPVTTENCRSHYSEAKTLILKLTEAELNIFRNDTENQEIVNARATYEHWCSANGDSTPYSGTIVSGTSHLVRQPGATIDSAWIIVAVLVASAVIATALIFVSQKKRRAR